MDPGPLFLILLMLPFGAAAVAIAIVRWIARPIESLARSSQRAIQFTLSDLLVLFAVLQLTVGTVHYLMTKDVEPGSAYDRSSGVYVSDAFVAVFTALCWWCGASMVSRAGIQLWWHRAIVLGFVVPCGIASGAATVATVVVGLLSIWDSPEISVTMAGIACAALAVAGVCGATTRWIAAKYPLDTPTNPPDTER